MIDTKNKIPFTEIECDHMFYAHNLVWIKITNVAARSYRTGTNDSAGVCNFMLEGPNEDQPEMVHYINMDELTELLIDSITYSKMQENMMK